MESERMLHPIIDQTGVDTKEQVVKEEKRMRYDNSPYGKWNEEVNAVYIIAPIQPDNHRENGAFGCSYPRRVYGLQ